MSSFNYGQIGRTPDGRRLIRELQNQIAETKEQITEIETTDYKKIVRSNGDLIMYVGTGRLEINAVVQDPNLKEYQLPTEPDGRNLTCWYMFSTYKPGVLIDSSGFNNNGSIVGSPAVQDGPVEGLPAWQFELEDQLRIPNDTVLNTNRIMNDLVDGFSIQFRIFWIAVNLQGNVPRIVVCKTDDSPSIRQYGYAIWLEPDGTLYFHVRIAGVYYTTSKQNAAISLNEWFNVACIYDAVTHTPKIYIDGVFSGEGVSSYVHPNITLPTTSLNMYISGYDNPNSGRLQALMSDFRFWKNKVLTVQELQNLEINSYSISPIQYVARIGTWSLPENEAYDLGPDNPPPLGSPPPTPQAPPPPTPGVSTYFDGTYFDTNYFM